MARKDPLLSARELALGGVERNGPHVSFSSQHGAFIIYRHPDHPAGHKVLSCKTLRRARTLASALRNEKPQS